MCLPVAVVVTIPCCLCSLIAESDSTGRIVYDERAVEDLLDRSKQGVEQKLTLANEYLSSFKVASYVIRSRDEADDREILKVSSQVQSGPRTLIL